MISLHNFRDYSGETLQMNETQHIPELKIIKLFMFKHILKVSKSEQWNKLLVNLKLLQRLPTCTWHVFTKDFTHTLIPAK